MSHIIILFNIFLSHSSPPSTNHMINVDFQVLVDSKVFVLAPHPLPLGNGRFQQTTTNGNNMQCGQWMKRQERVEQ